MHPEIATSSNQTPPPVDAPPYAFRPPSAGIVRAAVHEEDFMVPLGVEEQSYAFEATEFLLFFKQKAEPERLADALAHALVAFPLCAGRFVENELVAAQSRTPLRIQAVTSRPCISILCNNAGAGWSVLDYSDAAPSSLGPVSNTYVDFVSNTKPSADGQFGEPLFKAKLSTFIDGQILAVSFAQGLSDCVGISQFLKHWSCVYRGDDPGQPPVFDRLELDDLFRRIEPGRVKLDFALLNRARTPMPSLAPEKSVVSFTWSKEEVQSLIEEIQNERKKRNVTLDRAGKNLEALDIGSATILQGYEAAVPVHTWVDYRTEFEVPRHFGNARGQIAFDMPTGYEDIAEMMRRRVFAAHRADFWGWQRTQGTKVEPTGIMVFPVLDDSKLQEICFHAGDVACVGLPLCLWEEQMKSPGYIAVLPESSGGCHVEALVPRLVAARISQKIRCKVSPIR
jgi:hypothetical protein